MTEKNKVKIKILLPQSDWHSFGAETIWATPLGDNLYRIENSPFFADSISYHDIVLARFEEQSPTPLIKGVTERSGNSTYRIVLEAEFDYDKFCLCIQPATAIGCTYESLQQRQFSLNVPPSVRSVDVHNILQKGEEEGVWFFEPSHVYTVE